jgi:hypothetical protein
MSGIPDNTSATPRSIGEAALGNDANAADANRIAAGEAEQLLAEGVISPKQDAAYLAGVPNASEDTTSSESAMEAADALSAEGQSP